MRTIKGRNEYMGLAVIGASLIAASVIAYYVLNVNMHERQDMIRNQGRSLVRVLAKIGHEALSNEASEKWVQAVAAIERNPHFAYLSIQDANGNSPWEVLRPGVVVPHFQHSIVPSSWYFERLIEESGTEREVLEFSAPIFGDGQWAGNAVLGFFNAGYGMSNWSWSFVASLSLPVFLLGVLSYLLYSREMRLIDGLGGQLQQLASKNETTERVAVNASGAAQELVSGLNDVLEKSRVRMREIDEEHNKMLTTQTVLHYRKARLEAIVEELTDGIMVLDESGIVSFANSRIEGLLGVNREALIGHRFQDVCGEEDVSVFLSRYQGYGIRLHRTDAMVFSPIHTPDKRISVTACPLTLSRDSKTESGTLVVCRDITADFLAKQAVGEFVAHVSHELKSPLNVLCMYGEMLLDDDGKSEELRVEAVNVIHDEVDRLSSLINNLLSISKMEMGSISIDRQRVRPLDLFKDAFESVSRNGKLSSLKFHLDLPNEMSPISVDKELFRVALNNLLTNAIKYNQPDGRVTLAAEETEKKIIVRVRDTGIGISPADLERIFEKFFRSNEPEIRKKSGHGLGLSLAKSIIEIHHGKLLVESVPGQGTEFRIEFHKNEGLVKEGI